MRVLWFSLCFAVCFSLPVVVWHGMGDDCCNPESMGRIVRWIENATGTFVHSIRIGNSDEEDTMNGFLKPAVEQVALACEQISSIPQLQNGFNAVGFSQGGQFLRALVQTCPFADVKNLIVSCFFAFVCAFFFLSCKKPDTWWPASRSVRLPRLSCERLLDVPLCSKID